MPKKVDQPVVSSNGDWRGYVNWNPLASEREAVLAYMGRKSWTPTEELDALVQSGYSVAFSWDGKSSSLRIAVTGKSVPCPNIGYTLSIRASSIERLLGLVGYYCNIVCGAGDWLVEKKGDEVW